MEEILIVASLTALLMVTLIMLAVRGPVLGLAVGLALLYNPIFNYQFLFSQYFEGGWIRATLGATVIVSLFVSIIARAPRTGVLRRIRTSVDFPLVLFLPLVFMGVVVGLVRGNDVRLLLSDLFILVEFYSFFFISTVILRNLWTAKRLIIALSLWGTFVAATEIAMYILANEKFVTQFALLGGPTIIPRLTDFMPAIFIPVTLSFSLLTRSRKFRYLMFIASLVLLISLLLSFYRSLWIGTLVGFGWVLWAAHRSAGNVRSTLNHLRGLGALVFIGVMGLGLIGTLFSIKVGPEVILGRILYIEEWSGGDRVEQASGLLQEWFSSPLWGRGFGSVFSSENQYTKSRLALFSASNYYLSLLAELGVGVLLYLLWVAATVLREGYRTARTTWDGDTQLLSIAILGGLLSSGAVLLFFPSLLHFPIPAYVGTLLASLWACRRGVEFPVKSYELSVMHQSRHIR